MKGSDTPTLHITLRITGLRPPGLICPCVYTVFHETKGIFIVSLALLCLDSLTQLLQKQRVVITISLYREWSNHVTLS